MIFPLTPLNITKKALLGNSENTTDVSQRGKPILWLCAWFIVAALIHCSDAIAQDANPNLEDRWAGLPPCPAAVPKNDCVGEEFFDQGNRYYGKFENNKRNGYGLAEFTVGGSFVGTFSDGWRVNGTQLLANGDRYVGDFKSGQFQGHGIYTFKDGREYIGQFSNNTYNGQGSLTLANGHRIEGIYLNGWCDYCTQYYQNGNKYVGEYKAGQVQGSGTFTLANGDEYSGQFSQGNYHGPGTYKFKNGTVFSGTYENGQLTNGKLTLANGDQYIGDLKNGLYEGKGVATFSDGRIYEGAFKAGKFHGDGISSLPDGSQYSGELKEGVPNGKGRLKSISAGEVTIYSGEFLNGHIHGQGTMLYPNGDKHIGTYIEGMASGFGTYFFANGTRKYVGSFKAERFSGLGVEYLDDEVISRQGVWLDGELIEAKRVPPRDPVLTPRLKTDEEVAQLNRPVVDAMKRLRSIRAYAEAEVFVESSRRGNWNEESTEQGEMIVQGLTNLLYESKPDEVIDDLQKILIEDKLADASDLIGKSYTTDIDPEKFLKFGMDLISAYPSGHYFHAIGNWMLLRHAMWQTPRKLPFYGQNMLNDNDIRGFGEVEYGSLSTEIRYCKVLLSAFSWFMMTNVLERNVKESQNFLKTIEYVIDITKPCTELSPESKLDLLRHYEDYLSYSTDQAKKLSVRNDIIKLAASDPFSNAQEQKKLGHLLRLNLEFDEAITQFESALKIAKDGGFEGLASSIENERIVLETDRGNYSDAEQRVLKRVVELTTLNGTAMQKCDYIILLTRIYEAQERLDEAVFALKGCVSEVDVERRKYRSVRSHIKERDYFTNRLFGIYYETLASLLIQQGRLPESQQVLDMLKEDEQFEFIRRSSTSDPRSTRIGYNATEKVWSDRYRQISDQLAALGAENIALQKQAKLGLSEQQKQRQKTLAADLQVAQKAIYAFLKEMRELFIQQSPARVVETEELSQQAMQAQQGLITSLGGDVALIRYVITDNRLDLILTMSGVQKSRSTTVTSKELNRQIREFRGLLQDPKKDPLPMAQSLYKLLFAPIVADIEQAGANTVMLSLDGTLRYLPFGSLHDGKRFLAQRWSLPIYTSVTRNRLLDSVNPSWQAAGLGVTRAHGDFAALPAVKGEMESIVKSSRSGVLSGEVYLDDAFTANRLRDVGQRKFQLMHVSSHFRFSPGTEVNSFLLLGDGQQLTLGDIRTQNYRFDNVDLLTLSACDTGLGGGRDENGREIEGFGVIAQQQGAKAVLATLWPVADKSTALLMASMYRIRQEQHLTKIEALRQAQLSLMALPRYSHPFYWAPFILMGNWK